MNPIVEKMLQGPALFLSTIVLALSGCGSSSSSGGAGQVNGAINNNANAGGNSDSVKQLVINEVVAKGEEADWIEFYNQGASSINLGDYSVIDDDAEEVSALPSVLIAAGAYYTVYATTDSLADVSSVGFKLGSSDSVKLFKGDVLIDELSWDKGDALFGFSYGRYPDGSNNERVLKPSLNASNQPANRGPLVINEVLSKDSAGGNDWFELYNNGATAIELSHYRIIDESDEVDGYSLPLLMLGAGEYVTIYATSEDPGEHWVPFKLGGSESLSLMLDGQLVDYLEWGSSDAPKGYSYGSTTDGSWNKNTLNPTASANNIEVNPFTTDSVESIYIQIAESDWSNMLDNALAKEYHPVAVTYKGVTLEQVAMRTKGHSSLTLVHSNGSTRFSFKLDINEYVSGQRLLGLKKFSLNNNFLDPTYMRDHVSYEMMRSLGLPAPRTSYANLYVNDELFGLYLLVEQVDSVFIERNFDNADGDLYKVDRLDDSSTGNDLVWIDGNFSSYTSPEIKTNKKSTDHSAFITMLDVLNNGGDLESVIDVDAVLRYLAVSTAMSNLDSYQGILAQNYYLYEIDGQFSIIPWDMNLSFGAFNTGCTDEQMLNFFIDEPTAGALSDRPLIAELLANTEYRDTYHAHLQTLIDGALSTASIHTLVTNTADMIREDVGADPTAFYTLDEFEAALTTDSDEVFGLTSFVEIRNQNIQNQLDGVAAASGDGSGSCNLSH